MLTAATFALNDTADAPDATLMLAGTVTELLLLAKLALNPPEGAAEVNDRVQDVVAAPVKELPAHDSPLMPSVAEAEELFRVIEVVVELFPSAAVRMTF